MKIIIEGRKSCGKTTLLNWLLKNIPVELFTVHKSGTHELTASLIRKYKPNQTKRNEVNRTVNEKHNILNEASNIINGERQDSYGKPEDSFKIIAEFWTTYLNEHGWSGLSALDVAHMMTLFKIARMLGQKPDRDNYIDAAGYLAIAADRLIRWPEPFNSEEL